MHPFVRNLVIGVVGLILSAALTAIAIRGSDPGMSVAAMLAAGLIAAGVGIFLFVQAWIWSQRVYQGGSGGTSVAIALAGGLMVLLAGAALAGCVVLILTFYV
jgi:hypothetical protein